MADLNPNRRQLKVDVEEVVDRALRIDAAKRGLSKRQFVEDSLRAYIAPAAMQEATEILEAEQRRSGRAA